MHTDDRDKNDCLTAPSSVPAQDAASGPGKTDKSAASDASQSARGMMLSDAPTYPGVYIMKGKDNDIIYIGKAKNLRRRVKSYFARRHENYKTQRLVEQVSDVEFIVTDTEGEAFLLESNMIKQYRPRFNIELKDQQRYTYLRVSDEKYPRLLVARRTRDGRFLGKGDTFGPFVQGSSKLLTVGALRKAFQIRICKTLPKKVCLEYHLGNCEGPCEFEQAQDRYPQHVAALKEVLAGKDQLGIFTKKLTQQMHEAAHAQQFERAIEIRDTLARLDDGLRSEQKMEYVQSSDEEYFGIDVKNNTAVVMTFRMIHGVIRDTEKFFFDFMADNTFSNFLYQYYTTHRIPKYVVLSEAPHDMDLVCSLLSERAGFDVEMTVPKSGKRRDMILLLMRNIGIIHEKSGGEPGLAVLQRDLGLLHLPNVIECFDISNHGASFAVGAMSRFVGGSPDKSGYRRFRIKTVVGRDDYAMMREVVSRRYSRILGSSGNNNSDSSDDNSSNGRGSDSDSSGPPLPDLVLIDGGRGHLAAALSALRDLGLEDQVPCASLAKENEEVYVQERSDPIIMPKNEQPLKILQHARDEAHRFGVAYNHILQKKILQDS